MQSSFMTVCRCSCRGGHRFARHTSIDGTCAGGTRHAVHRVHAASVRGAELESLRKGVLFDVFEEVEPFLRGAGGEAGVAGVGFGVFEGEVFISL